MKKTIVSILALLSTLVNGTMAYADQYVSLAKPMVCLAVGFYPDGKISFVSGTPVNLVVWTPEADQYQPVIIMDPKTDEIRKELHSRYLGKGYLALYKMESDYIFDVKKGQSIDIAHSGQPVTLPVEVSQSALRELQASSPLMRDAKMVANFGISLDPKAGTAKFFFNYKGDFTSIEAWDNLQCWNTGL